MQIRTRLSYEDRIERACAIIKEYNSTVDSPGCSTQGFYTGLTRLGVTPKTITWVDCDDIYSLGIPRVLAKHIAYLLRSGHESSGIGE